MRLRSYNLSSVNKRSVKVKCTYNSRHKKFTGAMRTPRTSFVDSRRCRRLKQVVNDGDGLSTSSRRPRQRRNDP